MLQQKMRLSVGLDYRGTSVSERLNMILAGPHGYPTEKVLNTGNKIGGEGCNSTANKKGCSNYSDATKRKLEDGWPESMSSARRQVILASSLRKFL